jgi:acyl-CoA thioester hydrolase
MAIFYYPRLTQFSESDAAGIIHFSKIACYAEEAEHACLRQAGFPVKIFNPTAYRWPRVNFHANYILPIPPLFPVEVQLQPRALGRSSITWQWSIFDTKHETVFCKGEMKSVCCLLQDGKLCTCPLPEKLRKKLLKD